MSIKNQLITWTKSIYYCFYEYILLRIVRYKYQKNYNTVNPLVSIIIATYNRSDILINRTLPSVLAQTYKNIEVIIVGDQCIDNTPELLKEYPDIRVRFYDLPKRGKYPRHIKDSWFVQGTAPRNKGMKMANGSWFVFISDDDVMYPHHIEVLLQTAQERNLEFISASYETIKDGEKLIVNPEPFDKYSAFVVGGMQTWLYRSYLKKFKWNIDAWRKNWNRPVDYDLQLRFYKSGLRIGHIYDIVYFNPAVEGTITTGYQAALIADIDK